MAKTKIMGFRTNQSTKFKSAIEASLTSNITGLALFEVDPVHGLKISSIKDQTGDVVTVFSLEPALLTNFFCNKRVLNKQLHLKHFLRFLRVFDEEQLNLYIEEDRASRCALTFGDASSPGIVMGVGLLENDKDIKPYSGTLSHTCKAVIPTADLKTIIPEMEKNGSTNLVSVDMTSAETKIVIGTREWEFKSSTETGENSDNASGQTHHVEFQWSHVNSLMKASSLAEQCTFALLPSDEILFQFCFEEGSFMYIKQAQLVEAH